MLDKEKKYLYFLNIEFSFCFKSKLKNLVISENKIKIYRFPLWVYMVTFCIGRWQHYKSLSIKRLV